MYKPLCPLWFRCVLCVPNFFVTQRAQSIHEEHNDVTKVVTKQ